MNKPVITVEGLSKQYRIGVREYHDMLRENLVHAVKAPFRRLKRLGKPLSELVYTPEEFSERIEMGDSFLSKILREGEVLYG